ncbi:MAG TPA: phosphatidate cytidylyltransferase [Acidimicrobiales bacterium]|nr:phosphatidate cytidylyltransferase [Acidimicrobiales bacterium]
MAGHDDENGQDELDQYEPTGGSGEPVTRRRRRSEGVRIIGAEEAARALKEGQAAGRRPDDAPRFGDVPERPSGPPPAQRFPLPGSPDATTPVLRPQVPAPDDPPPMPHWTEPPTGEVPRIHPTGDAGGGGGDTDDIDAWAGLPNRAPRWRDQDSDWAESDFDDVALADDEAPMGALDVNRTEHSDLFSFDEPDVDMEPEVEPARRGPLTTSIRTRQPSSSRSELAPPGGQAAGRDMGKSVGAGVAMAVVALVLFKAGPKPAMFLVTAVVTLAASELYHVFTRAGYRPATLLGLTATVGLLVGAYSEGEAALPLVLFLTIAFGFLWYLFRVVRARPTVNVAVTLLGFCWVGVLGSFAALLLRMPDRHGIAFLLGAVIATAGHDIGGLFFGSQMGTRPLLPEISPNKTVEGLAGGMFSAVFASVLLVGILPGISPWTPGKALALGLVVAVVAPLGDLCQSMIKRDLGVKDMGSLIPGHGGVLDRFDALLFVLPATYYLVKLLDLV